MSVTDDRKDKSLPVTAEVGGEGGSFADPTHQVATFSDEMEDAPARGEGRGGASSVATQAIRRDAISGGGAGAAPGPDEGMVRYPTEPPHPPSAVEGRGVSGRGRWKTGLLGAAAGAALALGLSRRRRR